MVENLEDKIYKKNFKIFL